MCASGKACTNSVARSESIAKLRGELACWSHRYGKVKRSTGEKRVVILAGLLRLSTAVNEARVDYYCPNTWPQHRAELEGLLRQASELESSVIVPPGVLAQGLKFAIRTPLPLVGALLATPLVQSVLNPISSFLEMGQNIVTNLRPLLQRVPELVAQYLVAFALAITVAFFLAGSILAIVQRRFSSRPIWSYAGAVAGRAELAAG